MKVFLSALILSFPLYLSADEGVTVTVTVTNIPGAKGTMLIGLYDSAKTFTKKEVKGSPKIAVTSTSSITTQIPNVKPGTYAVSVIQDLNNNGKLDRKGLMPAEPLGFSVIHEIPKGKPKFSACAFTVGTAPVSITVPLVTK
ncbi:MAG: DUF2141 domain-containing protein [Verrucomicrobiota bacterium]